MNKDPGKPPASSKAKVDALMKVVDSLDAMWNIQDALCDEALMEGTKDGDNRAQVHYNECMKLNAKRSELRSQIDKLRETEAERKGNFGNYGGRGLRKTRRRRRRGGARGILDVIKAMYSVSRELGKPVTEPKEEEAVKAVEGLGYDATWGSPPDPIDLTLAQFSFQDPGKPPRAPPVERRETLIQLMKRDAAYMAKLAMNLNAKTDPKSKVSSAYFSQLSQSITKRVAELEAERLKGPGIAAKGGKTRRRGKSKK